MHVVLERCLMTTLLNEFELQPIINLNHVTRGKQLTDAKS